jgi:hypothetical protein
MSEVTRSLFAIEQGDGKAAEELLPLVHGELRKLAAAKLAQERPRQTLQATALVHEAYLRLVDAEDAQQWNSRGHLFATAAEAILQPLWALGDFDYNGFVDDDDVTLLGVFYDPSAAPLVSGAGVSGDGVAAVPEPGTLMLAGIVTLATVGRILLANRIRAD